MPNRTYFIQECPTCGRRLQIRVEYLGRWMACDHCHGEFKAADSSNVPPEVLPAPNPLTRAEELLRLAGEHSADRVQF